MHACTMAIIHACSMAIVRVARSTGLMAAGGSGSEIFLGQHGGLGGARPDFRILHCLLHNDFPRARAIDHITA